MEINGSDRSAEPDACFGRCGGRDHARTCGTKCDGGGFVGDTDPVYPNMVLGAIVAGLVILGAQYWGKGDKKTINDLFCMSIRLAGVTSILFLSDVSFFHAG